MATYSQRVSTDNDNGYGAEGAFGFWTGDGDLAGNVGIGVNALSETVFSAFRFNNVTIPQGTTITSAYLKITASETKSDNILFKVYGIDEDDTANLVANPNSRSKTTANVNWQINGQTADTEYTSPDIKTVIQEIIDRGSWTSGNDLAVITADNGTADDTIGRFYTYGGSSTKCALLEINYSGTSPSASQSPSSSASSSPSASPSRSPSVSISPSPSQLIPFFGLKISKPGYNVLLDQEPHHLIFSSDYGTLKYFEKKTAQITFDANDGSIAGTTTVTHNLGYYPFVEVFVDVYIGSPSGTYEYVPFAGSGATVQYDATYKITTTGITLYAQINGISSSVWVFDFIIFLYKNDLHL